MTSLDDTQLTARTDSDLAEGSEIEPLIHLTIVCHPDPARVGDVAMLPPAPPSQGRDAGQGLELSRLQPSYEPLGEGTARPLEDPGLSRKPVLLTPTHEGGLEISRSGSPTRLRLDGQDVQDSARLPKERLEQGSILELGSRIALFIQPMVPRLVPPPSHGLVGESPKIWRLRREVTQVADLGISVLLRGESGTGKELVAKAIHQGSARRLQPFHVINMAAVPAELAASELFGAAKGAFSGADKRRQGYFERAHGGTLFLDEIGEMPISVQASMLRVLESGEIQPVGSEMPQKVDVRVIAATDADLEQAISEGRFRAPVLHRLAGFEVELPPLRQRRDDIARLFFHFLRQELESVGELHRLKRRSRKKPFVSADLISRLSRHSWPGNVRQLRNTVRQLVVTSRGGDGLILGSRIEKMLHGDESGPTALLDGGQARQAIAPPREAASEPSPAESAANDQDIEAAAAPERPKTYRDASEVSEGELLAALEKDQYRIQATAKTLGISRTSLCSLSEACPKVRKAGDLTADEIRRAAKAEQGKLPATARKLGVSLQGLKMRINELGLQL